MYASPDPVSSHLNLNRFLTFHHSLGFIENNPAMSFIKFHFPDRHSFCFTVDPIFPSTVIRAKFCLTQKDNRYTSVLVGLVLTTRKRLTKRLTKRFIFLATPTVYFVKTEQTWRLISASHKIVLKLSGISANMNLDSFCQEPFAK